LVHGPEPVNGRLMSHFDRHGAQPFSQAAAHCPAPPTGYIHSAPGSLQRRCTLLSYVRTLRVQLRIDALNWENCPGAGMLGRPMWTEPPRSQSCPARERADLH
jgi:hypothetical protein